MNYDLINWMKNIDDKQNLFSMNICGTHDCVTKNISLSHFFCCQNMTIKKQLESGVRALDIRAEVRDNRLKMVHAIMKAKDDKNIQLDMQDILNQCYDFLNENKSETIIFQYKNDSGKNFEESFDIFFNKYINKNADKFYLENRLPTLGEARGKIVFIRRCKMTDKPEYTAENTGIDFSRWVEQPQIVPTPLPLETMSKDNSSFIIQDRFKYKPIQRWNDVIKPFLDTSAAFDGTYIINYLSTAGGIKGPQNNAKYINEKFMEYPLDKSKYYGTIYTDFPSEKLIRKITNLNFH